MAHVQAHAISDTVVKQAAILAPASHLTAMAAVALLLLALLLLALIPSATLLHAPGAAPLMSAVVVTTGAIGTAFKIQTAPGGKGANARTRLIVTIPRLEAVVLQAAAVVVAAPTRPILLHQTTHQLIYQQIPLLQPLFYLLQKLKMPLFTPIALSIILSQPHQLPMTPTMMGAPTSSSAPPAASLV